LTYEPVFTHEEWQHLPIKFKQRWWTETNYGKRAPSLELVSIGWQHLEKDKKEPQAGVPGV
jgi:hypothetical protein